MSLSDAYKECMKQICRKCLAHDCDETRFQFHHLDGIKTNNKLTNIALLCKNHHDAAHRELSLIKARKIASNIKKLADKKIKGKIKNELLELQKELRKCVNTMTNSNFKPKSIKIEREARAGNYLIENPRLTSKTFNIDEQIKESRADRNDIIIKEICVEWRK